MDFAGVRSYLTGVGQSVAGSIVIATACAIFFAVGLPADRDFNNPKNWLLWAGLLLAFGAVGFLGTNAVRLSRIRRAPYDRFTVILADLVGDDSARTQKLNVRDALRHYLGSSIHILLYPKALVIGDGLDDDKLSRLQVEAQEILTAKRGDLLIWGRVKASEVLGLHFTRRSAQASTSGNFQVFADASPSLELPPNFDHELGSAIAARVVEVSDALIDRQGHFLAQYADRFAGKIVALATHPKPNWSPAARGALLHALAIAKTIAGTETSGTDLLAEAVSNFRAALKEKDRGSAPLDWANTQNGLSYSLWRLGQREIGTARLREAATAIDDALREITKERTPYEWAAAKINLGNILHTLAEREGRADLMRKAIAAFDDSLKELPRGSMPREWATAQNNLGNALLTLSRHDKEQTHIAKAISAFHAALSERTREKVPQAWAITQSNLGNAFLAIGMLEPGVARLKDAIVAYEAALSELRPDRAGLAWARTQNDLGTALMLYGSREGNIEVVNRAIAAFRRALDERTQDGTPFDWAVTQNNLGATFEWLGQRQTDTKRLAEAAGAFRLALSGFERAHRESQTMTARDNLARVEELIAQHQKRRKPDSLAPPN
jgi:tetratricopeptide (TPR) repeat protein